MRTKKVLLVQLVVGYSNFWQALQKIPIREIPKITNDRNYWKKQTKQPGGLSIDIYFNKK